MTILNPICGFLIVSSIIFSITDSNYYWLFIFPLAGIVTLNVMFYCHTHQEEAARYEAWRKGFSKTHKYLGLTWYYEEEVWENLETGEIICL